MLGRASRVVRVCQHAIRLPVLARFYASSSLPPTLHVLRRDAETKLASLQDMDAPVTAHGWIVSVRRHKTRTFVELTDGTLGGAATLQVVLPGEARELTPGQAVQLSGRMAAGRGRTSSQRVEMHAEDVHVLASTDLATYPLANVMHSTKPDSVAADIVRQASHFKARTLHFGAIQRTRTRMELAMAVWMDQNDFCKVQPPVITSSDCEGGGEIFRVVAESDVAQHPSSKENMTAFWSGNDAYLTVSAQLHLEAYALGLSRVWSLCPVFRAEGSATNRHLAEFWMLEAEMCWLPSKNALGAILDCTEEVIKSAIRAAWHEGRARDDMTFLGATDEHAASIEAPWPRISYTHAVQLLRAQCTEVPAPVWGDSLRSDHERWLAAHFGMPVFVTDFPSNIKPFYMRENDEQVILDETLHPEAAGASRKTVACFDLLVPNVGELVGGSVREERHDMLLQRMEQSGLQSSSLTWYIHDLRRYGGPPHGGFGIGMERLLSWLTHTYHVRDLVGFPRVKGPLRH